MDEELKAVAKVVDRLVDRFPTIERARIITTVTEEHDALKDRPVRAYVPVLVEHASRVRLRNDMVNGQVGVASPDDDEPRSSGARSWAGGEQTTTGGNDP